jgi:hypothetical protein
VGVGVSKENDGNLSRSKVSHVLRDKNAEKDAKEQSHDRPIRSLRRILKSHHFNITTNLHHARYSICIHTTWQGYTSIPDVSGRAEGWYFGETRRRPCLLIFTTLCEWWVSVMRSGHHARMVHMCSVIETVVISQNTRINIAGFIWTLKCMFYRIIFATGPCSSAPEQVV